MKRVLSVLHGNTFGGPHNRNALIASQLRDAHGYELVLLVPEEEGGAAERLCSEGLSVVEVPVSRIRATLNPLRHLSFLVGFRKCIRSLQELMRDRSIDLVQINGISNPHAAVAARRLGIPIVWQILDTFPPRAFLRLMMPYVCRTAGAVMSTGHKVARIHPGTEQLGDRLTIFFPAVDLDRFWPDPKARLRSRQWLGVGESDMVIGNLSNINPQKGHRHFVAAARALRDLRPEMPLRFVILGQSYRHHDAYYSQLEQDVAAAGFSLGRDFLIRQPDRDVSELIQAFDVFLMTPASRSEGIPTVIEEALAVGLPVVAWDVGSIGEALPPGIPDGLIEWGDYSGTAKALSALIDSSPLRKQYGDLALTMARDHFSVEACAAAHAQAYEIALKHQAQSSLGQAN